MSALGRKSPSPMRNVIRMFTRNPSAMVGLAILATLILLAIVAPVIAPFDPTDANPRNRTLPPSRTNLMGTDNLGRDVFSAVLYGARISLRVGLISIGIGASIGTLFGMLAAFYEGWVDAIIMRLIDILLAFPGILLAIVFVTMLGPGLNNVMIAVGIASVPRFTRVVRGSVLSLKQSVYVDSARALGASDGRIMFVHILPNSLSPIIVMATLGIATAILSAAGLSFLGLGAQPPTPEWGAMLSNARSYLRDAWWWATFPGIAIMITVLAMNLLGDGLRDAFDPRLRER
jgi:peptide/nickel transport system permease protein